ncbi:hypothetical protein SAMN04489751_2078 [Brevibacterium sandarakinum]|uniref:Uncharacterized protein n=1 Tax=Brevibacterium sandarakinum TaxID=629680 RepID=A0A1H1SEU0_BRESA|nr:hypothetical protein SAMN04489751_2078 [Brevibacterium sandarakinum]
MLKPLVIRQNADCSPQLPIGSVDSDLWSPVLSLIDVPLRVDGVGIRSTHQENLFT